MEKPGCKWIVAGVSLFMAAGFLFGGATCRGLIGNGQDQGSSVQLGQAIGQIGDFKIYDGSLQTDAANASAPGSQSKLTSPISAEPSDFAKAYGQVLDKRVTQALLLELAKENGFPLDDQAVINAVNGEVDRMLDQEKMQALMSGDKDLPKDPTAKQFSDYFKKKSGHTPDEFRQQAIDGIKQKLEDPSAKEQLLGDLANDIVVKGFSDQIHVTDDALKHSNDQYVTKRIYFNPDKHPGKDLAKEADEVSQDLKAKKITFEAAMDKYTDDSVAAGKKASDNTDTLDYMSWNSSPDFADLRTLKQGEVSSVVPVKPKGYAIYRLDTIINPPMPDFAKQKDTLMKTYLQGMSAQKLQDGLKALRKSGKLQWKVPGWGMLEDWYQATQVDPDFAAKSVAEQKKINQDFADKAKDGTDSGSLLTYIGAIAPIWSSASASDKKGMTDDYHKMLTKFESDEYASVPGRLELAKLDAAEKSTAGNVYQDLTSAAEMNEQGISDPLGQRNFSDIARDLDIYGSSGVLSKDQVQSLQKQLDTFRDDKLAYDKQMADQAKEEAKDRQAAMMEKIKEMAADKAKNPPPAPSKPAVGAGVRALPPVPGGATPPAPGGPKVSIVPQQVNPGAKTPAAAPKSPPTAPGKQPPTKPQPGH
jgi:hypothetical protein